MINNILKKIEKANEVQKVELEKHEVELALVDDLRKLANQSSKLNAENINLLNKVRANYKESISILSKVETEATKGLKMATDLGVGVELYKEFVNSVKGDLALNKKFLEKYS
jgi:hypothetical protein